MDYERFRTKFNLSLTDQQAAAVQRTEGPVLLLAVPGSGKTTVLLARLGCLVFCREVEPENILTVTYTVAATADLRRRCAALFGEELAGRLEFRTINGLCARIIRSYERHTGRAAFELLSDEGEITRLLRELWLEQTRQFPSESDLKELRTQITFCKNKMLREEEMEAIRLESGADFLPLYRRYQDRLLKTRKMDYDDQMVYGLKILRSCPPVLAQFQQRYHYLCVDEAQDTSKIQHIILRLLAGARRNLFLVGDEDQSIYGFRAAWPQALLEFDQIYPDAAVLFLEENFRSTPAIVGPADTFIRRNRERRDKHMFTRNPDGPPIRHTVLRDYRSQYRYLLEVAKNCTEETAVLYRNHYSAIPLIDLLEQEGVPYRCRAGEGLFFSHYTVRDVTDAIRLAFRPGDGELFQRLYYKLGCPLKKDRVQAVLRRQAAHPEENVFSLLLESPGLEPWAMGKVKALRTHLTHLLEGNSYQAVNRIIQYMGYGDYLSNRGADTSRLHPLLALANQNPGLEQFLHRLEELEGIVARGGPGGASCPFLLSTVHASKGLEYPRVILIDVQDGIFPSVAEPSPGQKLSPEDQATLEEERRLFYVALTRAKRQLEILTCAREFGQPAPPVSSFVTAVAPPTPGPGAEGALHTGRLDQYQPGTRVIHRSFGSGSILQLQGPYVLLALDSGECKKFDLESCLKKGLMGLEEAK